MSDQTPMPRRLRDTPDANNRQVQSICRQWQREMRDRFPWPRSGRNLDGPRPALDSPRAADGSAQRGKQGN